MPPLGRALMGLWASEAYSFRPVSTSRFPSILFHNTPGDVYVLQDARKMRSRLHSDIGKFTAGWKERREEGEGQRGRGGEKDEVEERRGGERSGWDLQGRPDYFSHRRSTPYSPERMRRQARFRLRTLTSRCEIRSAPPAGPFSRELDAAYLPGTERETNYSKIARR